MMEFPTPNFNFPPNFTFPSSAFGATAFSTDASNAPVISTPAVNVPAVDASTFDAPTFPVVVDAGLESFVRSLDAMERKLGKSLLSKDCNGVVCVPSAQTLLGLLYPGAGGHTAAELEALFGVDSQEIETLANFKKFISCLEVPEILVANAAYVAKDIVLKEDFTSKGKEHFDISINRIDFTNKTACARTINAWIQQKTRNLIPGLIDAGSIDDDDKLILLNTIYFKGKWQNKFLQHYTKDGQFTTSNGEQVTVQYMVQTNMFQYAKDEDYEYLIMPYQGGKLSMLIILPKDIKTFKEKDVSKADLSLLKFLKCKVRVKMPKFNDDSFINWTFILRSALPSVFNTSADFRGISDTPILVSKMMQKAVIKVDEEGTVAAAVTGSFGFAGPAAPVEKITPFIVERPFFYHIHLSVSSETKISLFSGHVVRPFSS